MRSSSVRRYIFLVLILMVLYTLVRRLSRSSTTTKSSSSIPDFLRAALSESHPHPHKHKMSEHNFTMNDGRTIPTIAFGTGTALHSQDVQSYVDASLRTGFRHLDGAQMYRNEDSLGNAIVAFSKTHSLAREALFVTTKLNTIPPGKTVRDTLVESLAKLKLDYVDLFLIHMPKHRDLKDVWKQMEGVHAEGLAKTIGVSNFRVADLEVIMDGAKVVPAVNQLEMHPYVYKASLPLLAYMSKHNILVESYAGLTPLVRFKGGPVDPVLKDIATRLGKEIGGTVTEAQVLQLWLRDRKMVAVTTSTKESRMREYLATQTLPKLSEADLKAIEAAGANVHHRSFAKDVAWDD